MKKPVKILISVFLTLMIFNTVFFAYSIFNNICYPLEKPEKINKISLPNNYIRNTYNKNSFCYYVQNIVLKQNDNIVSLYNNLPKINQSIHYAILNIDVGKKNLQQCADATMRIRAEYLFQQKRYSDIHFNFTSGDTAYYLKYAQGFRSVIKNNKVTWKHSATKDTSYNNFRKYLDLVFTYAGTSSLNKELITANWEHLQPGDILIQTGKPYGHAVIICDVATNKETKQKIYLLAQSYMPAQEIHILKNPNNPELSPWYQCRNQDEIITPEWTFNKNNLKRFKN